MRFSFSVVLLLFVAMLVFSDIPVEAQEATFDRVNVTVSGDSIESVMVGLLIPNEVWIVDISTDVFIGNALTLSVSSPGDFGVFGILFEGPEQTTKSSVSGENIVCWTMFFSEPVEPSKIQIFNFFIKNSDGSLVEQNTAGYRLCLEWPKENNLLMRIAGLSPVNSSTWGQIKSQFK